MAHRESDKFIVLNSLPEDEAENPEETDRIAVLEKDHIFKDVEDGTPNLIQPSFKNVVGLKDNYPNSFLRKDQVKLLLDFFLGKNGKKNRLLIVTGPKGVGKVDTIAKAVWYAKEHEE
jgi:flagellar biosynthesis GTPase FlhF